MEFISLYPSEGCISKQEFELLVPDFQLCAFHHPWAKLQEEDLSRVRKK